MKQIKIERELYELGYKMDFYYENGKLDAICIAKWEGENLVFKKAYKVEDIASILLGKFLKDNNSNN